MKHYHFSKENFVIKTVENVKIVRDHHHFMMLLCLNKESKRKREKKSSIIKGPYKTFSFFRHNGKREMNEMK